MDTNQCFKLVTFYRKKLPNYIYLKLNSLEPGAKHYFYTVDSLLLLVKYFNNQFRPCIIDMRIVSSSVIIMFFSILSMKINFSKWNTPKKWKNILCKTKSSVCSIFCYQINWVYCINSNGFITFCYLDKLETWTIF